MSQQTNQKEIISTLSTALANCWHAANTYDGNYVRACDHVMVIVANALKIKDEVTSCGEEMP